MTTVNRRSDNFQRYFLYFMMYCVIGWCYEVFLEVVVYRWGFSNRGILFGPYLPVYGVGALTFLLTLYPLLRGKTRKQKLLLVPVIFLGCALVATAIELAASYLCELTMGHWPWQTYVDYAVENGVSVYLSFPGALGKKLLGLQHKVSCSAMVRHGNFTVRHVVQQSFDAGTFVGLHACSAFLCAFRRTMNFN